MENVTPDDATREIGAAQGYRQLPLADRRTVDRASGEETNEMATWWRPSYEELVALIDGGVVQLTVMGRAHPPVRLDVVAGPRAYPSGDDA